MRYSVPPADARRIEFQGWSEVVEMHLPRAVYEALPFAYVTGGIALCAGSYRAPQAAWTEIAFALGAAGVIVGLVLLLRRRTYRADAARYDSRALDDVRTDEPR